MESGAVPLSIRLRKAARTLQIQYPDETCHEIPCELLRVYSPSAENRGHDRRHRMPGGKQDVNISSLEPAGNYGVRILFDDGHNSGIFSWELLFAIGEEPDRHWQEYLEGLRALGLSRAG